MIYRSFKDLKLSALGFGCMRFPTTDGRDENIDGEKTAEMIEYAMKNGVNYYDTAWGYHAGMSETVMGEILSKYPRESYYLASKFPGYASENFRKIEEIFNRQMEKCRVDHFDFYLMHCVCEKNIDNYMNEDFGTVEYFIRMRKEGKIRHLGFSCHAQLDGLDRFLKKYGKDMEFCQLQLNYIDWEFQKDREKVALLKQYGIPVWVMEPVRGGSLVNLAEPFEKQLRAYNANRRNVEWAFRFVQSVPEVCVILSGMSDLDQVKDNVELFSTIKALNAEEQELLFKIAREMTSVGALPCTACRYCVNECPQKLDIPKIIKARNEDNFSKGTFQTEMFKGTQPEEKWPTACLGCGACAQVCPQKIDIPAMMKEMAEKIQKV